VNDRSAAAVAEALDLDVAALPICYACLSFVALPLHEGDTGGARREARRVAPDIWEEGLKAPALDALRKAAAGEVAGAEAALRDAETKGGRGAAARSIVFRLATQLVARSASPFDVEATRGWAGTGWTRWPPT
jgi:hypothetical protein